MFAGCRKKRKSIGVKRVIVGYICKKCLSKHQTREFIKKHNIKPKKGQRMREAIREKAKQAQITLPSISRPRSDKTPTAQASMKDKIRRFLTKDRFFKRKGSE
jgi:carbamoylphosphate synthase large subunit